MDFGFVQRASERALQIQVNAANASELELAQGWRSYTLTAPLTQRLNLLQLFFDSAARERFAVGALELK